MNKLTCSYCGCDDNEYGLRFCKVCGAELFYQEDDGESMLSEEEEQDELHIKENETCILTTGESLEGYEIVEYLDVLSVDEVVRLASKSWLKAAFEIGQGEINLSDEQIAECIREAKEYLRVKMIKRTERINGNALIGVTYSTSLLGGAILLVGMTGTAVRIQKR